ncbi:MAG: sulfotransferase family protein [Chloroflexi bacterium]|nr:hypothetical protein [Ktedonobacteraceae bacterium]MBV9708930.1 sulfotransferase family protein [Chloroflexota bacterium]
MADQSDRTSDGGGLKIIGAGFGRTGTFSLKAALEMLGFGPCYHMSEVLAHPQHIERWEAALKGEAIDWQQLFADYQSCTDWPACTFYAELMQAYPEAKVLLSVRDPERWYESARSTIYRVTHRSYHIADNDTDSISQGLALPPGARESIRMISDLVWDRTFDDKFTDKDQAIAVFNRHIEEVKQRVPAKKLLVYNVKEGWEPLCSFLDVAVPEQPFPHLNDRDSFMQRQRDQH